MRPRRAPRGSVTGIDTRSVLPEELRDFLLIRVDCDGDHFGFHHRVNRLPGPRQDQPGKGKDAKEMEAMIDHEHVGMSRTAPRGCERSRPPLQPLLLQHRGVLRLHQAARGVRRIAEQLLDPRRQRPRQSSRIACARSFGTAPSRSAASSESSSSRICRTRSTGSAWTISLRASDDTNLRTPGPPSGRTARNVLVLSSGRSRTLISSATSAGCRERSSALRSSSLPALCGGDQFFERDGGFQRAIVGVDVGGHALPDRSNSRNCQLETSAPD